MYCTLIVFFFFKQKTAYEMRISDWSSDVCSSDLTPGASYGWDVVESSWSGPQYDLRAADDPAPRLPAQGWITGDAAKQLFAGAGLDLDEMYAAAGKRGFKAVPLDATVSFDL